MKKFDVRVLLVVFSMLLMSCGKDGDSSSTPSKTEYIFTDSAVTAFSQTGGVAKVPMNPLGFIMSSAYAVSGNVSCIGGEAVSFQMDALGSTVNLATTCNTSSMLDLEIRQALLESLDGHKLRRTIFGMDAQPCGGAAPCLIDFTGGFTWEQAYEIEANTNCHEQYTFYRDGRVIIDVSTLGGVTSACDPNYPETTSFRFREELMEFDDKKQFNNGSPDYERWCLDDDVDGNCD
jgi:hypothetical protein